MLFLSLHLLDVLGISTLLFNLGFESLELHSHLMLVILGFGFRSELFLQSSDLLL